MRARVFLIVFVLFCASSLAQNFDPHKDLPFGQIAAGGGYVSVLTVANPGTGPYSGVLEMYSGAGVPWNPIVNGVAVINGQLPVALNPGETRVFRITLEGSTESAFGFVKSADQSQASFIEGNLTYFVSDTSSAEAAAGEDPPIFAEGDTPFEGVGVPPSREFYGTVIAFEDPFTVALALANVNSADAAVTLTVFSEASGEGNGQPDPNRQALTHNFQIVPNGHDVGFLWQKIEGLEAAPGWLQIQSDMPIIGTALTFVPSDSSPVGSLFASLPLEPTPSSYTFTASISGIAVGGEIGMWANGPFVNGYIRLTTAFGLPIPPERFVLYGELQSGILRVSGYGSSALMGGNEVSTFMEIENFSFASSAISGSFTLTDVATSTASTGTGTLNKVF